MQGSMRKPPVWPVLSEEGDSERCWGAGLGQMSEKGTPAGPGQRGVACDVGTNRVLGLHAEDRLQGRVSPRLSCIDTDAADICACV